MRSPHMPLWKGIVGKSFTADEFPAYLESVTFHAWRPQFIVLHNTGAPTLAGWHSVSGEQRMLNLENYYKNGQKWSAGPHLFVADDKIWVFTPLNTPGVHSPSWNAISWGVEMVGNFDNEIFADPQQANVMAALAALHAFIGIDPSSLRLHHEDPKTTHRCPGSKIQKADVIGKVQIAMSKLHPGEHQPGSQVLA